MRIVIKSTDIASCGINCTLCRAFRRPRNRCSGCTGDDNGKPVSRITCRIKNCPEHTGKKSRFCFLCDRYPCTILKQLDKRYRTRYGISMLENLSMIQKDGVRVFIQNEKRKWRCPECGNLLSVHSTACLNCGVERRKTSYSG